MTPTLNTGMARATLRASGREPDKTDGENEREEEMSNATESSEKLPLLGVCIPTYKRPDQLRLCLLSVVRSAAPHQVPIFVADDSLDDTNAAVIAEVSAQYPGLHWHRNTKNLGVDGNILNSVDLCAARHAWIMGEDDRLLPHAIAKVLDVLRSRERPFVYVNYASVDESLTVVLSERSLQMEADREESAEQFAAEHAWSMAFIGACVVQKSLWAAVDRQKYVGTWYAHVGTILEFLAVRHSVYLVAEPLVLNRCGSASAFTWRESTFDVLSGWGRMIDMLGDMYPPDVRVRAANAFRQAHRMGSIPFFVYLRSSNTLTKETYRKFVRGGPYPIWGRAAAWLMVQFDHRLFRFAADMTFKFRRLKNRRLSPE